MRIDLIFFVDEGLVTLLIHPELADDFVVGLM